MKHAGRHLGAWLKAHRKKRKIVLRVFAGQIAISPAEYAEVELGITHWLKKRNVDLLVQVLKLEGQEESNFRALVRNAGAAKPLRLEDVYSRKQLEPVRLRRGNATQVTHDEREKIVDSVFAPLA